MNAYRFTVLCMSTLCLILGVAVVLPMLFGDAGEFVCYDDGALAERHVLVARASYAGRGDWRITYTDGQVARYRQAIGESCQLETTLED